MKPSRFFEQLESVMQKSFEAAPAGNIGTGTQAGSQTVEQMLKSLSDRMDVVWAGLQPPDQSGANAGPVIAAITEGKANLGTVIDAVEKMADRVVAIEKSMGRPHGAVGDAGKSAPPPSQGTQDAGNTPLVEALAKALNIPVQKSADTSFDDMFRQMRAGHPIHLK